MKKIMSACFAVGMFYPCHAVHVNIPDGTTSIEAKAEVNGFEIAGGGCHYVPQTSVLEPCAVCVRDTGYRVVAGVGPGQAGGILLTLDLHVMPLDVSFSGVKIEEVPDAGGSHSGYFADAFSCPSGFMAKARVPGVGIRYLETIDS